MNLMKRTQKLILLSLLLLMGGNILFAQTWEKKQASLMTQWASQVTPDNVFPEYPRPQMVRSDWMNLNGLWELGKNKSKHYIMPIARESDNNVWKYITGGTGFTVPDGWNSELSYNDAAWSEGSAGFGNGVGIVHTKWTSNTIYLRKKMTFEGMTQAEVSKLKLQIFFDEDFELYINGVLAASSTGYTTQYLQGDIAPLAKNTIKVGEENLIAIKCIQTTGGQYIDAGLFVERPTKSYGIYNNSQEYDREILVPFPIESALSGVMDNDYDDITKWYAYRREFTIPDNMKGKEILLHFGAVDWRSTVFVNGQKVGEHEGGFDPFFFNITDKLNATGANELVVHVFDPSSAGGQPYGKQHTSPGGIFYTPATGIWQTVWLESVNTTVFIRNFRATPDIDNNKVTFNVITNSTRGYQVKITVFDNETKVAEAETAPNADISVIIKNPKLWDTENPFLYDVKFELLKDGKLVDEVKGYFGMRKISIAKIKGTPWMVLNNKPVFQFGVLDQGYWPDGVYTPPTEEAMIFDIQKTRELGFNMIRKHIKTEPARWYHACDKMGMLVWQDIPNGYEGGNLGNDAAKQAIFKKEMEAVMNSMINSPSIIVWTIFNEAWGQYNWNTNHVTQSLIEVDRIDTTRIINATSGWTDVGMGQLFDRHSYPDVSLFWDKDGKRPSLCGESGGLSLVVEGHTWQGQQFVYEGVKDSEALKDRFIDYVNRAKTLQMSGLTGVVYTQITDVEGECNGLITYDRIMKNTPLQIAAIKAALENIEQNIYIPLIKPVNKVKETGEWDKPGARPSEEWKYTTNEPAGNWKTTDYDDSSWSTGKSGFGASDNSNYVVGTEWSCENCDIYLRKDIELNLTADEISRLKLQICYDDNVEVYFNGVLAFSATGSINDYQTVEIEEAAAKALIADGKNTIAVRCKQNTGGQYIDLGLFYEAVVTEIKTDEQLANPPSGISDKLKKKEKMNVYPNPTGDLFMIDNQDIDIENVTVFDVFGKKIKTMFPNDYYSIGELINGLYLLQIKTKGSSTVEKIMKK